MKDQKDSLTSLYRHYKDKPYQYLGEAWHSETQEEFVLYKALYPNELGPLWVRPKKMFHESILINGNETPRFKKIEPRIEFYENIDNKDIEAIISLSQGILTGLSFDKIIEKINRASHSLLIMAYDDTTLIGFKLGYFIDKMTFYSWLGALSPQYQAVGIGSLLMKEQHLWCLNKGITEIHTKTMNHWQSMIRLNLKNGFKITGTEKTRSGEIKILMTKYLL